ncbi:SAM-dependent chlorinase/fluorinase [Thermosynechococcaceae cyanobacterium BACA0444]|uniref:SAM-dependent chlorinase/fluorinase n=1 Tax=Pseudocalidococcus azoricus BACA0444 TaxID=2918990 RepID=A0AAE4FP91_9CYAN|nr:SAM-dependent chlorinase/fluorinase [Pseudocalidococcus azoricus]MDS3859595.1 SAM-dependent chlorinase/fluorinase [Pseudocalidococcus azoricus BACA0444]
MSAAFTPAPMITLLTDFGYQDSYAGILRGIIFQINPTATIIDLTHGIAPHDCHAAMFQLRQATPYFNPQTIHLAVVDPGVGSSRRGLAIQTSQGVLVGPDNGIFTGVLHQAQVSQAVELTNPDYWLPLEISTTFHGRDIFAPVAAHLSLGVALGSFGNPIDPAALIRLPGLEPEQTSVGWRGIVQGIDHFGNVISTLPKTLCQGGTWMVQYQALTLPLMQIYSEVSPDQPIALIGSHGWLEIAINQGSAAQIYGTRLGDTIYLYPA